MSRVNIIDRLYARRLNAFQFSFESLTARPLFSLLNPQDIEGLRRIATSIKLSSKPKEKYRMMNEILVPRGFKKIASGTNRVAYKFLDDQSIVLKVALDKVGMTDNPNEYYNQFKLAPFVTKVFEVSPCGTVGLFERVVPITTIEEYVTIADDVFTLIVNQILGKYVVDDIGTNYFQNIGVRPGFGPVLLDFPYVYELDGNKLFCNVKDPITKVPCGGEIDYDDGFNKLICTKCGKQYFAYQLASFEESHKIQVRREGGHDMNISVKRGNKTTRNLTTSNGVDVLPQRKREVNVNKEPISITPDGVQVKKDGITIHRRKKSDNSVTVNLSDNAGIEDNTVHVKDEPVAVKSVLDTEATTVYSEGECNSNISVEDYRNDISPSLKNNDITKDEDNNIIVVSNIEVKSVSANRKNSQGDVEDDTDTLNDDEVSDAY